ncbi:MAG: L,D-transpeptidase [Actinomycetota bacterium]|nr:L,D-transpeptidase [Actinomycetota bacterium]
MADTTSAPSTPDAPGEPTYEWAPAQSRKRSHRGAWWAGGIAVTSVAALVAASLVLIAPGTAIAGVSVGGLTPGAAAEAVSSRLAQTQVVLTGPGDDAIVTGAQLGAQVDAEALADAVYAERPMWNPSTWFSEASDAVVQLDDADATAALRAAVPAMFTDPVDAVVAFDADKKTYVVTPAVPGEGIDVASVAEALQHAFAEGRPTVDVRPASVQIEARTPTFVADAAANILNGMIAEAGFYVGDERTVPISAETLASWLTIGADDRGAVTFTADVTAIQQAVDGLAEKVDRKAEPTTVIADGDGKVLNTLTEGRTGRTLGATTGVAAAFAQQLESGSAAYALPVTVTEPTVTKVSRSIEVDLSQQRVYLRQDGKVVKSFLASTGKAATPTFTGTYRIGWKLRMQNMGNEDLTKAPHYYTENVPWVMYFNGDQAFHGAYWHNNFGRVMSHGCINLRISDAKYLFDWAPNGTVVWIHG